MNPLGGWLLSGWSVAQLGALAAIAGGWLTFLYLLKQPRRRALVPFVALWQRALPQGVSLRRAKRLRAWLSWALQLLMLLLLAIAFGDPRPSPRSERHIVLLIDTSASMQARDEQVAGEPATRLAAAEARARSLLAGLGPEDRLMLVAAGAVPLPLSGFLSDVERLKQALSRLSASDAPASASQAFRFAEQVLRGRAAPQIVWVTDGAGAPPELGQLVLPPEVRVSWIRVGQSARNVGVSGLSVRRYPLSGGRYEVQLDLVNSAEQMARLELALLGDGQVVLSDELELGPGEARRLFFPALAGARRLLEARVQLSGDPDVLAVDDRAWALLPSARPLNVLLVSAGNRYLEAALLLDASLSVTQVRPQQDPPPGEFDVTILDGVSLPPSPRWGGILELGAPPAPLVRRRRAIRSFGFDRHVSQHPVWRFIQPRDVQVLRGHALAVQTGDVVLGRSERGPILVAGEQDGRRLLSLGFDPRDSDFVLRVAWPLFVSNSLHWLAPRPGDHLAARRTGELWALPPAPEARWLFPPQSGARALAAGLPLELLGQRVGVYRTADEPSAQPRPWFAANLASARESQIAPAAQLLVAGRQLEPPEGFERRPRAVPWVGLVAVWLLVSTLEWWTFHRRWTV